MCFGMQMKVLVQSSLEPCKILASTTFAKELHTSAFCKRHLLLFILNLTSTSFTWHPYFLYQKRQWTASPCPSSLGHLGFHRPVSCLPKPSLLQTGKSQPTQFFLVQKPFQSWTILVALLWTWFQVLFLPFWDGRRQLHSYWRCRQIMDL